MGKCRCHHIPKEGCFQIGAEYDDFYIIDGIYVIDDNGDRFDLIHFYGTSQNYKNKS